MSTPLVPTICGTYADSDTIIVLFEAAAAVMNGNPIAILIPWYFQMRDAQVVKAIAFFDIKDFDEFWNRVSPGPCNPGASKPTSAKCWGCGNTGICLCG